MKKLGIFVIMLMFSILFISSLAMAGDNSAFGGANAWTNTSQSLVVGGNNGYCYYGGGSQFMAGQQSGNAGLNLLANGGNSAVGGKAGYNQDYSAAKNIPGGYMQMNSSQGAQVFGNVKTCGCGSGGKGNCCK